MLSEHPVRKLRFDGRVVRVLRFRAYPPSHERRPSTKLMKRLRSSFDEKHTSKSGEFTSTVEQSKYLFGPIRFHQVAQIRFSTAR